MENLKLNDLLLEMRKNYTTQPVFLFSENAKRAVPVMYPDFLADLDANVKKAEKIKFKRIAIAGYNTYDWIVTAVSLLLSGKTLILLNPDLDNQDCLHLLEYTDTECVMLPDDLKQELAFLENHFSIQPFFKGNAINNPPRRNNMEPIIFPDHKSEFLCFTSGTSQSSKAVVINTETLVRHIRLSLKEAVLPLHKNVKCFMPLPLYHIYALTFLFHPIAAGSTLCLSASARRFTQDAVLFNPDVSLLVASMVEAVVSCSDQMPSLKYIITGGGACRSEVADMARAKGLIYYNGYGSSESIAMTFLSVPDGDEQWMKPLSCIQCGVSDEGELWIKTPYHFDEYYKKPEDTRRTLKGDVIWTGDAALQNEQGYIHLIGRLRDTIAMENGEKIHAEDMDYKLSSLKHSEDAAVVYSPEYGMAAVIVPDLFENKEEIESQIDSYNKTTSPQFRIRHLWFREEKLPRTSTGKLKRYQLADEFKNWLLSEEKQ